MLTKLLWDPEADPRTLADEWIKGMFGPAADEMMMFYACVEKSTKKTGKPFSDDPPGQVPGLFDRVELERALLNEAEVMMFSALNVCLYSAVRVPRPLVTPPARKT